MGFSKGVVCVSFVAALLGSGCRSGSPATSARVTTPAEIAVRATPSVVSIRTPHGLGTGFVVREDGWIATNLHVLAGESEGLVVFANKLEYPILEVVALDKEFDLVVARIEAQHLPVLSLGDSDYVRPGERVVAIGHPLGLEDTVSDGLISAVRNLGDTRVLQISAPIAPGSSGGPLFNDHGEVIGVATAIIDGGQNLSLAVPVSYLKAMLGAKLRLTMKQFALTTAEEDSEVEAPKRDVPRLPSRMLDGCDARALKLIVLMFEESIGLGAKLAEAGHFSATFHLYEGTAIDIERKLPASCRGPAKALADGRKKAGFLREPAAQVTAMRDAMDGVLDVIVRKVTKGE